MNHTAVRVWYHLTRELFASQKVRLLQKHLAIHEKEVKTDGVLY